MEIEAIVDCKVNEVYTGCGVLMCEGEAGVEVIEIMQEGHKCVSVVSVQMMKMSSMYLATV